MLKRIVLSIGFFLFGPILTAFADPWSVNPLYLLDQDKLCSPPAAKTESTETTDAETPPETKPAETNTPKNISAILGPGTNDYYWRVDNEHIIDEVIKAFSVSMRYSDLLEHGAPKALKNLLAPCHGPDTEETKDDCNWEDPEAKVWHAPSARFSEKSAQIRARVSLLKLFNAAETGRINGFVVLRNKWSDELSGFTEYQPDPSDEKRSLSAFSYRPFVNPHLDDELLADFIDNETHEPEQGANEETEASIFDNFGTPFVVVCHSNSDKPFKSPTIETPSVVVASTSQPATPETESNDPRAENAVLQSTPAYLIVPALSWIGEEREFSFLDQGAYKNKSKLQLVSTPADFAKADPDSAELKLVAFDDSDQNLFTGNAALGFRFKWAKDDDAVGRKESQYSLSLTPYLAANFEAIEAVRLEPTLMDPLATKDVQVAFGDLSAGLRLDYVGEKGVFERNSLDTLRKRVARSGVRRPGWRWSATWERFTDNYNQQHGERTGVEIAVPDWFSVPGYRKRFAFVGNRRPAPADRDRKHNPLRFGLLSGWAFEWDADFAYDRVDFLQAPLNFETVAGGDRQTVDEFSVPGVNTSLYLGKQSMLGYAEDDGWLAFTAEYVYRTGYETTPFGSAEKWEVGAEFNLPNFDEIELGAKYEFGRDFKTLQEIDAITLEAKLKY